MDVSFILQTSAPFLTFSLMINLISKHPSALGLGPSTIAVNR